MMNVCKLADVLRVAFEQTISDLFARHFDFADLNKAVCRNAANCKFASQLL